jgi:hypothetical protein
VLLNIEVKDDGETRGSNGKLIKLYRAALLNVSDIIYKQYVGRGMSPELAVAMLMTQLRSAGIVK